ncbi:hypothetical protein FA15DRAFT_669375 [Coprinopsis marcescibilis]|uniref:Uncharacterized protein n=1 Tax=Coprinopsis marcescibilis TaxID=230819 RepID=A0A5C3L8T5_COPMA|nr:hypothetical protein FA15DRAFT_669375 [Coprinopsis marcescibilis]
MDNERISRRNTIGVVPIGLQSHAFPEEEEYEDEGYEEIIEEYDEEEYDEPELATPPRTPLTPLTPFTPFTPFFNRDDMPPRPEAPTPLTALFGSQTRLDGQPTPSGFPSTLDTMHDRKLYRNADRSPSRASGDKNSGFLLDRMTLKHRSPKSRKVSGDVDVTPTKDERGRAATPTLPMLEALRLDDADSDTGVSNDRDEIKSLD